ncbi:MAG: 4-hydroxythreonine-4-phosphate dehydrogenase PdxA [Polyangiaceae bacterium]|nr:4-hydroxythreonine-4-phosphate dehydrogenase PdxA [Polyangiaceae bacterium]
MRAPIAVSCGCPSGVGVEIAVRAAARTRARVVLVGDARQIAETAARLGVTLASTVTVSQPVRALAPRDRRPGAPSQAGGRAQLAYVDHALDLVTSGHARALATGPVSKEAIATSGAAGAAGFRGHTEHLQARLGADEVVMAFVSKRLATSLVTTHLPLAEVPRAITPASVASATFWLASLLRRLRPEGRLRVAVAGLNPHAGEGGLLGDEEARVIAPGVATAARRAAAAGLGGVSLEGPIGAETAYRLAARGELAGVVAMYHDQATVPMKLLSFGDAVNISLGLPIVRTSVDHGTGYDKAGTGTADPRGMLSALRLADALTR